MPLLYSLFMAPERCEGFSIKINMPMDRWNVTRTETNPRR